MRTLVNIPGRPNLDIPVFDSKVPKPEDVAYLPAPLLRAVLLLGRELKDLHAKWAIGGDAGEIIKGVHVKTDHLEILTTKEGCFEVCELLAARVTAPPEEAERRLAREADVEGRAYPVRVRGLYAELSIDGVRVEVHGDEQIRVGEWEWGDPLDFEPEYTYVVRARVPIVPLRLKSELDLGLGWLDRLELISSAVMSGRHHLVQGGIKR
ncbi:MAG: hypothetical protein ABSF83_15675 [Nitrososphaerales archaeon]|jgi:hypothetical protein